MSVMYGNAEYEDFKDHPEGKFEGIVYCWKYQGEKTNAYGDVKKRAMLRVESMDEFMEDGRPFSVAIFHNISWGIISKRNSQMPVMQELREKILDIKLTEENWYEFDPKDLMDVRVKFKVHYEPRRDGNGHWVNVDIIDRIDDQSKGERENPIVVVTPEDADENNPTQKEGKPSAPPPPSLPEANGKAESERREHVVAVIELLAEKGAMKESDAEKWSLWVANEGLTAKDIEDNYPKLESMATKAKIDLPEYKAHPMSSGSDDLPF